jgi:uncharacterized protein
MTSIPPPEPLTQAPPEDPGPPRGGRDVPPWPAWTAPAAFVLGFIGVLFVGAFAGAFGRTTPPAVELVASVLIDAGFVAAAVYMASQHGGARRRYFGFRRISARRAIGSVLIAGVGYFAATQLYGQLFHLGNEKLPKEFGISGSTAALVGTAVFVCAIAPIAEEFFFRGFIFGALRRWRVEVAGRDLGTWMAAVVTGILFGLVHGASAPAQYLIPLGFFGFVLCLLRWRTRSLYPGMALHSINNSLALGIGQEHWRAAPVAGLILGALVLIGLATVPLAEREPAPVG